MLLALDLDLTLALAETNPLGPNLCVQAQGLSSRTTLKQKQQRAP